MYGIIGIIGNKGAGKSTVANYLVGTRVCIEYAFADPIKEICTTIGVPRECVYGTQQQKEQIVPGWGVSGRQLMQTIGTELFRTELFRYLPQCTVGNVWIQAMAARLMSAPTNTCAVLSDVRFDNEADFVRTYAKEYGGFLLRIVRNGGDDTPTTKDQHVSEHGITNLDDVITIQNNGTVEELYAQLDDIIIPRILQLNAM